MFYLTIGIWVLCSIISWWMLLRYMAKKIEMADLYFGIPFCLLFGPFGLVYAITLVIKTKNSTKKSPKVFQEPSEEYYKSSN